MRCLSKSVLTSALACALAICGVSSASADTLNANLNGVLFAPPYTTVTLQLYTDATQAHIATDAGGHAINGSYIAGAELWTRTGGTATVAQGTNFKTYCIEITQDVVLGQGYGFTLNYNLANTPVPGSDVVTVPTGSGSGMGTGKADLLSRLWAADYTASLSDANHSAAFQLAIWKIVYADPTTSGGSTLDLNLADGQLVATGPSSILSITNTWLGALAGQTAHANLVALTSGNDQDQITAAAPAPATAGAGYILLAALGARLGLRKLLA